MREVLSLKVPQVVLLDLELPIRRGVELLRTVREACPDVPIIARVHPRSVDPKFFTLRTSGAGLSLEPVERDLFERLSTYEFGP